MQILCDAFPRHWGPRAGTCPDAAQRAYLVHSEIQASPPSSPAHTRTILQIIHIDHVIGLRKPTKPPNENHLLRGSRPSSQFPSVSVACMSSVYASPFRLFASRSEPYPAPLVPIASALSPIIGAGHSPFAPSWPDQIGALALDSPPFPSFLPVPQDPCGRSEFVGNSPSSSEFGLSAKDGRSQKR